MKHYIVGYSPGQLDQMTHKLVALRLLPARLPTRILALQPEESWINNFRGVRSAIVWVAPEFSLWKVPVPYDRAEFTYFVIR